jgi:PAS domain S-box-containing protein
MRLALPLVRHVRPSRAPVLRYGVALLSTTLALIPAWSLPNVAESRLAVFAVAVMVSAWYGGWKPGLVATSFALTVIARFSLAGPLDPQRHQIAVIQLVAFFLTALLICWFNAALRSAQEGLRRSEANFRSLVTNAPYGICRCDSAGKLLDANPALLEMLGYSSVFDIEGLQLRGLYVDSSQWFDFADCIRVRTSFQRLPADWRCKDGTIKLIRVSGRAVTNGEGETVVFELFAEDVTERRALEQQLYHSQKMEAVGRLAGGIAHDFNNLLMVISGYSELLLGQLEHQPALRTQAQQISTAAARAAALTRQLLAFSRKQMLVPKVLDLNAVVTENLEMLTRLIGEDVLLAMVPGADLSKVKADVGQLEQVIMNLAVNARDAMPSGGKLTIETANVVLDETYARSHLPLKAGPYVMLKITDTGAGIDPVTQSHIFDPFFTTKGTKGTGLGLSTVYGIVKQSGGYIWVDSEKDKGAAFTIYLPPVLDTGEPVIAPAAHSVGLSPRKNVETILLVEDEPNLRYLARQYLEKQGYDVIEAADGAMAMQIAVAREGEIHLLLTDVIMPGMNGRELASRISEIRPSTRVLYMSGYTENVIGHNGMLDTGVNFLQKPFNLTELSEKVRKVLDSARQSTAVPPHVSLSVATVAAESSSAYRAKRFYIRLPLRYRELGESAWHKGTTQNISRSGLLFQAEETLHPRAELEINLVLPAEIAGLAPAEVVCRGEVVRSVEPGSNAIAPALAARILQYYFQHGPNIPRA